MKPANLENIVKSYAGIPILVVGDLILDRYVWGTVDRISPEAPVVVVKVKGDSARLGGAANVAHNLICLGAKVALCGVIGDDSHGQELIDLLAQKDIDTSGIVKANDSQTTVKTRVIAHAQQIVRVDREDDDALDSKVLSEVNERFRVLSKNAQGIIISDYGKGALDAGLFHEVDALLEAKKMPVLIDPKEKNFNKYRKATFITPNRKEAQEASGMKIKNPIDAVTAGKKLLERWSCDSVLVTLGEMGMVFVGKNEDFHIPTVSQEVYDVSGAGDTVAATFLLSVASKASFHQAAYLANHAAGIVVRELGTAAVTKEQMLAEL